MTVRGLLFALTALLALVPASAHAAGAGLWDTKTGKPPARHDGKPAAIDADRFRALTLDHAGLRELLAEGPTTISLPTPGGGFARFAVRRSTVMTPRLSANHPEIDTYSGEGLDDPRQSIHLDLSPIGFHASVRGPGGTWYIDPYYERDKSLYASYHRRALKGETRFEDEVLERAEPSARLTDAQLAGLPVSLRTYRLAFLTDPAYSAYHGAANAKAAKVALINRVNQFYEDDLGITMQLVAGDLELDTTAEMTNPDGPCGEEACFTEAQASECTQATLDRTMVVLGQLAGADTFDVGHLGLGKDGGGVAYPGVVGYPQKAGGCTGMPTPRGDFYAVDYVAHELGHQFAGRHTFNGTLANCAGGNRMAGASVEPGSGSSIMAYAGICGADDLQDHSDPYFSQRSLQEIASYVSGAPASPREVQNVALRDFDTNGDAFRLTVAGNPTVPIVRGSNYTGAGIQTAIQRAAPGLAVTVTGFAGGTFGDAGFRVTFDAVDRPTLGLTDLVGTTGAVGTQVQGGPTTNRGHTVTVTPNTAPEVTAPVDAAIPVRTPFRLVGSATDANGDPLSYSWEQNDTGSTTGVGLLTQPKPNGPLFRQFSTAAFLADPLTSPAAGANGASTSPERVFPDMAQIAANNTNAGGSCPAGDVECFSEFLPTASYAPTALNFRLTARDSRAPAGGVAYDDVRLTLAKSAGPFMVTGPTGAAPLPSGGPATVTWDVAGTAAAPVNAANVEIRLSTDSGKTFTQLVDSTPNDGSATVTLPAIATATARFQVAAVGNYFFDVSDADVAITATEAPIPSTDPGSTIQYTDAFATPPVVSAYDSDSSVLTVSAPLLPAGLSLEPLPALGKTRRWHVTGTTTAAPGTYTVPVTVTDGAGNQGTITLRIVVAPETATATYTGETTKAAADKATVPVRLAAMVTETPDGTPGDITTATVSFSIGGGTLCSAPVAVEGTASCTADLPRGANTVSVVIGGRYDGTTQQTVVVTGGRPPTVPKGEVPAGPAATSLLAPVLARVARRPKISRTGRFTVPVKCSLASSGTAPERCTGVVVVTAKVAGRRRTVARTSFTVAPGRTARVQLRLTKAARRALRSRRLNARLSVAVANGDSPAGSARKAVVLRRP